MKSKILLIDDDELLHAPMQAYFKQHQLELAAVTHPLAGLKRLAEESFDLLILDVMLPDMDGFDTLRQLRLTNSIPVIMLTARGEVMDRVVGLELGADDYLPKPFEPRELVARVQNILKRCKRGRPSLAQLSFEYLAIDTETREVFLDGKLLQLTNTDYELLVLLASEPGRNFTRDEILNRLKGIDVELYTRSVDIAISRLRQKLKPYDFVRTVWGTGYVFSGKQL